MHGRTNSKLVPVLFAAAIIINNIVAVVKDSAFNGSRRNDLASVASLVAAHFN